MTCSRNTVTERGLKAASTTKDARIVLVLVLEIPDISEDEDENDDEDEGRIVRIWFGRQAP